MTLPAVDTPAVLIDIDRVDANIDHAQAHAELKLRPHIKTHKLPMLAARQVVACGAVGIPCQKLRRRICGRAGAVAGAG